MVSLNPTPDMVGATMQKHGMFLFPNCGVAIGVDKSSITFDAPMKLYGQPCRYRSGMAVGDYERCEQNGDARR